MAVLAVERHVDDLALDPLDAALLRMDAKELRIEPGVEVKGVNELRQWQARLRTRAGEASELGCNAAHRPFANVRQTALRRLAEINLVKMYAVEIGAMRSERMEVAFAD